MGSASQNLLVVKGDKRDIDNFKQLVYKNDSEAFLFQKIIPLPDYFEGSEEEIMEQQDAYSNMFYGNRWGTGFSVLARQGDNSLTYFFNSKYSIANLKFIARIHKELEFKHIGLTTNEDYLRWNYYEYEDGLLTEQYELNAEYFDFQIHSDIYAYEYMAELLVKFESLISEKKHIFEINPFLNDPGERELKFYDLFFKFEYLRKNKKMFDDILIDVKNLNKQNLSWAKQIGYAFRTNDIYHQLCYINNNYTDEEKNKHLDKFEKTYNLKNKCRSELIEVALYYFRNLDRYDYFNTLMIHIIESYHNELIQFKNNYDSYLKQLEQYPGVKPYFNIETSFLDKVFGVYGWDTNSELEQFYRDLDLVNNVEESEFDKMFFEKVYAAHNGTDLEFEERKSKIKTFLQEAQDYYNKCAQKCQKIHNSELNLPFDITVDTQIKDSDIQEIKTIYGINGRFPNINLEDDLPF